MSLLEEILADKAEEKPKCAIMKMLVQQTDEMRKEVEEVINSEIPSNRVTTALHKFRGIRISDTSLRKHRRGDCACERT